MRSLSTILAAAMAAASIAQGLPPLAWSVSGAHSGRIQGMDFSPDGRTLATVGEDKSLKLWRASDGAFVRGKTDFPQAVGGVRYSPDGRFLATCSFVHEGLDQNDHTVRVFDSTTLSQVAVLPALLADVQAVAWSKDGSVLACSTRDGWLRSWKTDDWTVLTSKFLTTWPVMDLKTSPDGTAFVSLDFSGDVREHDVQTLEVQRTTVTDMHSCFPCLAFGRGSRTVVAIAFSVMPWIDRTTGQTVYKASQISQCYAADTAQDGRTMLFAGLGGDREIEVWDVNTARRIKLYDSNETSGFDHVFSLACVPGSSDRYAFGTFKGNLRMAVNPYCRPALAVGPSR
ncbi:MAG: hypothetical protein JST30_05735 [Armatimonadetes bacterium]|nr:hypothetical protein [Armatimonadota bacterium]